MKAMRPSLPIFLAHVAAIVAGAPGCSVSRSSCDGYVPVVTTIGVDAGVACAIAQEQAADGVSRYQGDPCEMACGGAGTCNLPDDYTTAFAKAQAAAPDAGVSCPGVAGTVALKCSSVCEGRLTEGLDEPETGRAMTAGEYFAACSYLEAASVHAFARLARELEAHGAPASLIDAAWRAQADELRHAHAVGALARRFSVEPTWPDAPDCRVRSLAAMAQENAIEGCVRETYGAALAWVRAARAADAEVRAVMRSIARDECEHAELSWRVAAWALPRLAASQRESVRAAMRAAVRSLVDTADDSLTGASRRVSGMPAREERCRLAAMLDDALFRAA